MKIIKRIIYAIISMLMAICCVSPFYNVQEKTETEIPTAIPTVEEKVNIYKAMMDDELIVEDDIKDKDVLNAFEAERIAKQKAEEYYQKYLERKAKEEEARKAAEERNRKRKNSGGCIKYGAPVYVENADGTKTIKMTATAYAPTGNRTATGTVPTTNRTIATDPNVIPSGTHVMINGQEYIAEDTGGAIKGNRVDIFMESESVCNEFGVQDIEVTILD